MSHDIKIRVSGTLRELVWDNRLLSVGNGQWALLPTELARCFSRPSLKRAHEGALLVVSQHIRNVFNLVLTGGEVAYGEVTFYVIGDLLKTAVLFLKLSLQRPRADVEIGCC